MMFNEDKFQFLYGRMEEIKIVTEYRTNSNNSMQEKTDTRDLGVMMSDLTFKDHKSVATARKMISRTFKTLNL